MSPTKVTTDVACPACGQTAQHTQITEHFAVWTGEYEDDGYPAQETMTACGFYVECHNCSFADGEPPTW